MAPYATGYVPGGYDPRDHEYNPSPDVEVLSAVDLSKTKDQWLTPIYDQGQIGSCVANAVAAAIRYLGRQLQDDKEEVSSAALDPSRLFIYYNARALPEMQRSREADPDWPSTVSDSGSETRNALKTLKKWGVCAENAWEYKKVYDRSKYTVAKFRDRPPTAAYEEAYKTKALAFFRLDPLRQKIEGVEMDDQTKQNYGSKLLDHVKHCLSEGYPVVFGFWFYDGITTDNIKWDPTTKVPGDFPRLPTKIDPDANKDGHAVLIIGYDDSRNSVLIQNSWGPDKNYSRFWMHYEWIKDWDASDDFWTIRNLDGNTQPPPAKVRWTFMAMPKGEKTAVGGSSTVATVSRKPDTLEVMWIDQEGAVRGAFFYGPPSLESIGRADQWKDFSVPLGKARSGSSIVAVSCGAEKMQVFWIGENGFIQSKKYHESRYDWKEDSIPNVSGLSAKSGLTALSRKPGLIEVWWKTETGGISGAYRYDSPDTEGEWNSYTTPTADDSPNGNIVSLSRHPDHQEIWWADSHGKIRNRYFEEDWKTLEKDPEPFAIDNSVADSSRLTAASRDKDNMALFYVTPSGNVRGAFWRSTSKPKWKEDSIIGRNDDATARVDSDIKAISFDEGQVDLVWVGPDCSIRAATVYPETESTNGKRPMRNYTISGSGTVSGGSPLGLFKFPGHRAFGIVYVDKDGTLMLGYCNNPV